MAVHNLWNVGLAVDNTPSSVWVVRLYTNNVHQQITDGTSQKTKEKGYNVIHSQQNCLYVQFCLITHIWFTRTRTCIVSIKSQSNI